MATKKQTHGGAGRGQGRKPLSPDAPTVPVSIKLTTEQRDKLARLGGPKWLRARIDKAREPSGEVRIMTVPTIADPVQQKTLMERSKDAMQNLLNVSQKFNRGEILPAELEAARKHMATVQRELNEANRMARERLRASKRTGA